ncbi:pyruvate, phosphate dikinase [Oceanispirochaeta crateris]|uniref:Pyruvate, phosphate dikinase n=1 Tax=Oceanispirochaeta crateris TaxID=2518645 RepID=A0A5C1QI93_9SPIO|nr:pyruvate, phosphate dikinase [Oceanispirochaeta crateris]QEN07291.1 pyruvate, phosphate dikinase [Oceanispirochaeta crateris]
MSQGKFVYFFGGGSAEGKAEMKDTLGGKGANLAEMTNLGIPVPPGFTISTDACELYYENNKAYPEYIVKEVEQHLKKLEAQMEMKLGDHDNPLLVSVRSGAAVSMPGMMDTVLNLGLNEKAVEGLAARSGNERFAWDAYRRFIQMFGDVVKGVPHHAFEGALESIKMEKNVENDNELDADDLKKVVSRYLSVYKDAVKEPFPQDPKVQLWAAIDAVFGSWKNERADKYRAINKIEGLKGTAVNVQSMVFGNFGETSGTGVCFSRDPSTGENYFYGEYLMNAQGEDVVAGIRTPEKLSTLQEGSPAVYAQLVEIKDKLENHYKDMQDMEFTIQDGKLYILQTRNGKRTGQAAVQIAVDLVKEKMIDKKEAIMRVAPAQLDQLLHPMIDPSVMKEIQPIAKGLNASPGAACGKIVFTAEDAEAWFLKGEQVILVRKETSPEDIGGMNVAQGILTSTGGMTSHAAVVARGMGTPCVAGCKELIINQENKTMSVGSKVFKEGNWCSLDGTDGLVYEGAIDLIQPELSGNLNEFLTWADDIRNSAKREGVADGFGIRANADLPVDALKGREFGAEGIGLCRTEHMFFDEEKLKSFRIMIVADSKERRVESLKKIMPLQTEDFEGIFRAMDGLPVNIRLLDPPLHEFVPRSKRDIAELADIIGISKEDLQVRLNSLEEQNPMLGHRGCRLGITYPEIYDMQVEAIARAAVKVQKEGIKVLPEIMIPLIGTYKEFIPLRENAEKILKSVFEETGITVEYQIGTMIEIPRAALTAEDIAKYADYFSFGTNDLTQMTFGYSRDDVGTFVPEYVNKKILKADPFQTLDQHGVGLLVELGVQRGRSTKANLKTSICGEHGGDPDSIDFCYRAGLNVVSCSPYRVPIARLAAAQAVIRN